MNKIDDLLERLDRVRLARDMEPEPDGLSLSLWAFEDEMASLDEIGIAALAAETNEDGGPILTLEQAQRMADGFRQDVADRRIGKFRAEVRV